MVQVALPRPGQSVPSASTAVQMSSVPPGDQAQTTAPVAAVSSEKQQQQQKKKKEKQEKRGLIIQLSLSIKNAVQK